jgi:ankyrin repeat protein
VIAVGCYSSDQDAIDKSISARLAAAQLPTATATIDAGSDEGLTLLHIAAMNNSLDLASLLLDQGADIDAKDDFGWTPLHWTARKKYFDLASLLLDHGANTYLIDLNWMN